MEETNFIGLVYSTLEEAGVDTTELTLEEAIDKYNELIAENSEYEEYEDVTLEEVAEEVNEEPEAIADEPLEEVVEEAAEVEAEEEKVEEEVAEEEPVEEPVEEVSITEEEYANLVVEHKEEIIEFLKSKGII